MAQAYHQDIRRRGAGRRYTTEDIQAPVKSLDVSPSVNQKEPLLRTDDPSGTVKREWH